MKPFHFRLDSVMRHQGRKRDKAQADRASAQARVLGISQEIQRVKDDREQRARARNSGLRMLAHALQQDSVYQAWFENELARLGKLLHLASLALQEKDRALRLAQREYRKFEMLREKRYKAWQTYQEKLAQKQLDEIATQSAYRRAGAVPIAPKGGNLSRLAIRQPL